MNLGNLTGGFYSYMQTFVATAIHWESGCDVVFHWAIKPGSDVHATSSKCIERMHQVHTFLGTTRMEILYALRFISKCPFS